MKNFNIRFILLVLLVVVGPTIQKMVIGTQQRAHLSAPISNVEESKLENETEESDGQLIYSFLKYFKHVKLPSQFTFQASFLFFSLADNIVLPPPQL